MLHLFTDLFGGKNSSEVDDPGVTLQMIYVLQCIANSWLCSVYKEVSHYHRYILHQHPQMDVHV